MIQRSFKKALFISFLAHIIVFGGTLAYAFYSGGLLNRSCDALTVSLVQLGDEENRIKNRRRKQADRAACEKPSADETTGIASLPKESIRLTSASDQDGNERNEHGADIEELPTDSPVDRVAGGNFGMIPPEEWELIRAALERTRYYPRLARRRGIQGVVRLRFRIGAAGRAENVEIVKSSGFRMLDTASIRTVSRAGPLPRVKGWIEVPIGYVLK